MKTVTAVMLFAFSTMAHAGDLKNCEFSRKGQTLPQIAKFDIYDFNTNKPQATIDGSLFEFEIKSKTVRMAFSNECDNMFDLEFKSTSLAKAHEGRLKKLVGKAQISQAADQLDVSGIVTCDVAP